VKGVAVQSGGDPLPAYELGMNFNHWPHQGNNPGYHIDNILRQAQVVRGVNGGTVDGNGWPDTTPGSGYILIDSLRWPDMSTGPYSGKFYFITDGAFTIDVIQVDIGGGWINRTYASNVVLDGRTTKTQYEITIPPLASSGYIRVHIKSLVDKGTEIALVNERYLADYVASNGTAHLNRDLVEGFYYPLAIDNRPVWWRPMKGTKANRDHSTFPANAWSTQNLSWHESFTDPFDILNNRWRIPLPQGQNFPTVTVGETITQASSGASATVEELNQGAGYINIDDVVGTFDGTGEIIASTSGSIGSPAGTPYLYVPTEHAMPYEAIIDAAAYWNLRPWINLHPNISLAAFDAFCAHAKAALDAGDIEEMAIALGNEIFFESGQNSADWFIDQGVAKWGTGTIYGTSSNIGRVWKARQDMILYDRMRTNFGGDMSKVIWVAEEQPGYVPSLQAYIQVEPWVDSAPDDLEDALLAEWLNPATNPIKCWSFGTYYGDANPSLPVSDWTDVVQVEASVRQSLEEYVARINTSVSYARAVFQPYKAEPLMFHAYEGGLSVYNHPEMDQYAPWTRQLTIDANEAFRAIGVTGTLAYADISFPAGSNGAWNHGLTLLGGLDDNPRGLGLQDLQAINAARLVDATGQYNGDAIRGMVLISDPAVTTYNGLPVEEVNFLSGVPGAGGNASYIMHATYLINETDTLAALPIHEPGDVLVFFAGIDQATNGAGTWFGEDDQDTSWNAVGPIQSTSGQYATEGFLWWKVAGANEPSPTLHLDASPPVFSHGQGILVVLKNVDQRDGTPGLSGTLQNDGNPWTGIAGTDTTDESVVLLFSADRQPNQAWTPTPAMDGEVAAGSVSLGPLSSAYFGYYYPDTTGPTGDFTVSWFRPCYRPIAIVVSFSKA
jgi:hypothetical protein